MITPEEAIAEVENRVKVLRLQWEWINKEMGGLPVVDRANQIHCLFEGVCPRCGWDVDIIRVGGHPQFLEEMQFTGDHEIDKWEADSELIDEFSDSGGVEFKCSKGHEYYIGYSFSSGDWH